MRNVRFIVFIAHKSKDMQRSGCKEEMVTMPKKTHKKMATHWRIQSNNFPYRQTNRCLHHEPLRIRSRSSLVSHSYHRLNQLKGSVGFLGLEDSRYIAAIAPGSIEEINKRSLECWGGEDGPGKSLEGPYQQYKRDNSGWRWRPGSQTQKERTLLSPGLPASWVRAPGLQLPCCSGLSGLLYPPPPKPKQKPQWFT